MQTYIPFYDTWILRKKKKLFLGNKYVSRGNYRETSSGTPSLDINGKEIHDSVGETWTCVDLAIDDQFYKLSLVLENTKGNKELVGINSIENTNVIMFNKKDADKCIKKFGVTNWNKILKGKIAIGFTEEMARLTWGEPIKINRSSSSDQWVYDNSYLYFRNGRLTSWK